MTRDFPPRFAGGISTAVGGLASALTIAGAEVSVVSFDGYRPKSRAPSPGRPQAGRDDNIATMRVTHPAQLDDALAWARSRRAQICHCHHDLLWPFAEDVGADCTALSAHVLHREQQRLRGLAGDTLSSAAQDRSVSRASRIFAPSHAARAQLLTDYPACATKIDVVPLAVSERGLADTKRSSVVFSGRFADIKGVGELTAAMTSTQLAGIKLMIIGGAPDSPKSQRRWQRKLRAAAEVGDVELEWIGWTTPNQAYDLLARAEVALFPSWIETFGLGCAEAMQAGSAVIASDIPALRELVEDNVNGVLVAPQSARAMATQLRELVADPARCRALGSAARESIQSRWTWRHRIGEWMSAYRSLVPE